MRDDLFARAAKTLSATISSVGPEFTLIVIFASARVPDELAGLSIAPLRQAVQASASGCGTMLRSRMTVAICEYKPHRWGRRTLRGGIVCGLSAGTFVRESRAIRSRPARGPGNCCRARG